MTQAAAPPPSRRGLGGLLLRLVLSGALLGYLLSGLDRGELADAMTGVNWLGWLAAVFIYLLSQIASGVRWAGLARPIGFRLSWLRFQQLYFEGMFFSLCLPSSIGGDVVKALRLGGDGRGRILAACTVLADRVAGVLAIVIIGVSALAARQYALSLVQSVAIGVCLLAAILAATRVGFALLGWPLKRFGSRHALMAFLERLLPYHHHPYVFWNAIGWSLVVQGLNILAVFALGEALGLGLPLEAYCIAVPVIGLLSALPISLNGVGVREGGLVWIFASYGVAKATCVALGLLWLSVTVAAGLVGGLVYLLGPPIKDDTNPSEQPLEEWAAPAERTPAHADVAGRA